MTAGIIANLGFEAELAGRPVPSVVTRQGERFAFVLRLVPGFENAVSYEEAHDRVVAWGPSGVVQTRIGAAAADWPEPAIVRWANDKRTSHEFERQLKVALPGAASVENRHALESAIASIDGPWVAKDPWGVAGRGQVIDNLPRALELLNRTGALVVEPWCTDLREFSIHLDVTANTVRFIGTTELLTDESGTFRGNRVPAALPDGVEDVGMRVGELLGQGGWRGPVGIDGFQGRLDGAPVLRPLCEVNARWSFGRLTIELARQLNVEALEWHHPPRTSDVFPTEVAQIGCGSGQFRLPERIDPGARSKTYLTIGTGPDVRSAAHSGPRRADSKN